MLPYRLSNLMAHAFLALAVCFCLSCDSKLQGNEDGDYPPQPAYAAYDKHPCWSGVHDLIAYVHDQQTSLNDPDSSGIYLINPDGSDRRLFFRGDWIRGLDWSPDGQSLVINIGSDLWKISYPDKVIDTLMQSGAYYYPSWSPNGSGIVSAVHSGDGAGIYIFNLDGSNYRQILENAKGADWPYTDSLIYVNLDYSLPIGAICMADTGGSARRVIYDSNGRFTWSNMKVKMHRETERILFQGAIPGESVGIWKLDGEFIEPELLINRTFYSNFSPDGNQVVFTIFGPHYANLWIINWDGTALRQLTEPLIP